MGYLGKISAIVSANTSDFQSKMSGAAKDVQKFASSMQGALSAAQTKSSTALRGIYTEAQKLERALQAVAGKKLAFKGFDADGIQQAVGRMQALYSATKQINQPLAEAAASLNKLPASVQAGFLPAMVSAQTATEKLADTINRTGTASEAEFAAVAKKVDLVTASMRRLQEASGMVSRLTKGDSLKFASPRTFDALSAAERSQRATDQLPGVAVARMGIGQQQAKVAEAAARLRDMEAVRERRMVRGVPTADVDAAIADETNRLEAQIRVLDRRNEAAQKYALIMKGGFVPADDFAKSAKQVAEGPKAQGREKAFQDEVAILKYRSQAEKELEAKRVAAEEKVFQNEVAALKYRAQAEAELEAKRAAAQRKAEDNEIARLINKERAGKAAEDRRLDAAAIRSAAEEMRKLKAASDFGGRFNEFFETSQIDSYKAKLMTLRQMLVAAGVSGGAAAEQLDKFAETLQESSTAAGGLRGAAASIKAAEQAAASAVATATGRSEKSVMKRLAVAGDIGRMGVDKFSLALNQAAFAIDDFFSSTGGIEFKLRAVSNNITQLAFILGGTTGLFIGLSAVIGGQVAVAVGKYIGLLGDTKAEQQRAKALTEALNASFDKQRSIVDSLAQSYRTLANEIKKSTAAPQNKNFVARQQDLEDVRQQQADRRREALVDIVPAIQKGRQRQNIIDERLKEPEVGLAERRRLRREADRIGQREDARFGEIDQRAAQLANKPIDFLRDQQQTFANRRDSLERDIARVGEDDPRRARFEKELDGVSQSLAEFTLAIQRYNDDAADAARNLAGPIQEKIQAAQDRLGNAFGDRQVAAQTDLQASGKRLADIVQKSSGERPELSRREATKQIAAVEKEVNKTLDTARALEEFAKSLNDASEAAKQSEDQVKQRVRDLERQAAGSPNDPAIRAQLNDAPRAQAEAAKRRESVEAAVKSGLGAAGTGDMLGVKRQEEVARRGATSLDDFADTVRTRGDDIKEGFTLAGGDAERFARQIVDANKKLDAAVAGGLDKQKADAARAQIAKDAERQIAPMVFDLAQQRENAELQGPSRQALNVSDISTQEGAKELNRLLRGDDSAKDVNLAELKQQTSALNDLRNDVKRVAGLVGVAN